MTALISSLVSREEEKEGENPLSDTKSVTLAALAQRFCTVFFFHFNCLTGFIKIPIS